jgi:5'(3')-deoxyribonucleotidase
MDEGHIGDAVMGEEMRHVLYLDMDGVLADFEKKAIELFGDAWHDELELPHWGRFTEHPNIYDALDPMPDAKELYEGCCEIMGSKDQVQILTALPNRAKFEFAARDKINWSRRYIDPDVRVVFGPHAQDKQHHVRHQCDVLIDDMIRNVEQWKARGGVGILHLSAKQSLATLEEFWFCGSC